MQAFFFLFHMNLCCLQGFRACERSLFYAKAA